MSISEIMETFNEERMNKVNEEHDKTYDKYYKGVDIEDILDYYVGKRGRRPH